MAKIPRHHAMRILWKFKSRLFGANGSFMIFGIASLLDGELQKTNSNQDAR